MVMFSQLGAAQLGVVEATISRTVLLERIHPADRELARQGFQACLDQRRFLDLQLRLADTADGDPVWVRLRGGRLDPRGESPARIHGIVADTSSRALTQEVHSRLAAIVSSSDVAIVGKTLDGIITDWNCGAEAIFGYGSQEVTGKPISILLPEGGEDEETVADGAHPARRARRALRDPAAAQGRHRRRRVADAVAGLGRVRAG